MSTTTITDLPDATTPLTGNERVPMDQAGTTKDATTQDIADLAGEAITAAIDTHDDEADPHNGASPTFADLTLTGLLTAPHIHGTLAGDVYVHVKNTSGGTLAANTAVYVTGSVGDTDRVEVAACDPTDPAKMPAIGLLKTALANNAEGDAVILGELRPTDTSSYTLGDELYVGAGGALVNTIPASGTVQHVGSVARVQAETGTIVVGIGAGMARAGFTGAYDDLSGTPTLGTAALLDVGTTAGTVAAGDDSRFTTDLTYTASTRVLASSTGADATLPLFTSTEAGLTPLSGGGTTNFLRADGTWAAPVSGGTPGGTTGQIQWNSSGSFAGVSGSTVGASGDITLSANGAASTPPVSLTGTWFSGGTSTTTKPQLLIEPTGTTSTAWNTSGTGLGVNAPSGFAGNLLDLQVGGTSRISVNASGVFTGGTSTFGLDNYIGAWLRAGINFQLSVDTLGIGFKSGIGAPNAYVVPEANNLLSQRNGTNAQTYRLYNTYTSATSFERAKLSWNTNVLEVGTEKGGDGGTARDMVLQTDGTTRITLKADGAILFSGLPTSDPAVAGQLWNDGNTLKISAG